MTNSANAPSRCREPVIVRSRRIPAVGAAHDPAPRTTAAPCAALALTACDYGTCAYEGHNPVTGLPTPLRVLCRLTRETDNHATGRRQPGGYCPPGSGIRPAHAQAFTILPGPGHALSWQQRRPVHAASRKPRAHQALPECPASEPWWSRGRTFWMGVRNQAHGKPHRTLL
jgi:hypothetical protein